MPTKKKALAKKPSKKSSPKRAAKEKNALTKATKKSVKKSTKKTAKKRAVKRVIAKKRSTAKSASSAAKKPKSRRTGLHVVDVKPMHVAAIVDDEQPMNFQKVWGTFHPEVAKQGLAKADSKFAAMFQLPQLVMPPTMDWYAAALILKSGQKPKTPLNTLGLIGGKYVTWTYAGPYDGLGQAWGGFLIMLKAAEHRHDASRPCFEVYAEDGSKTEDNLPHTQLYVPLKD